MTDETVAVSQEFVRFSCQKLLNEFWPRICTCLDSLTEEQVWWRPNESSNSIGNLLLHLNGNVRQWIVSALGNSADRRERDAEFAERSQIGTAKLRNELQQTLQEVERIVSGLKETDLLKRYTIQGYDVTALRAVYHVVEHFGMHCGQILYITKMLKDTDLGFYRHLSTKRTQESGV